MNAKNPINSSATLAFAHAYLRRSWSVVPIPLRSKKPIVRGWERLRLDKQSVNRYFNGSYNIGVLLGEASKWLIDVDLDHPLALELAPAYLPTTGSIFGRTSKRRSHWLYYSSRPVSTRQWRLPNREVVVELRSTGGQTVFPPSVHVSSEPIEWDVDLKPAMVDPDLLTARLQAIYDEVRRRLGVSGDRKSASETIPYLTAPNCIIERARKYLAKLPPAVSGQGGHNSTFRAACVLVIGFGLDRKQALELLGKWNEKCQPPWSAKELEHKVADAMKQPGWRGHLLRLPDEPQRRPAANAAIERANRHALLHRRKSMRRSAV